MNIVYLVKIIEGSNSEQVEADYINFRKRLDDNGGSVSDKIFKLGSYPDGSTRFVIVIFFSLDVDKVNTVMSNK